MKINHILISLLLCTSSYAYESMHEKTPVGKIIILDLPERTALEATTEQSYFNENNGLFRKLFRYINQNNLGMTTPVEANINPGKMRFFVGTKDLSKDFDDSEEIKIRKLEKQKVVSIGIRGSYTEKRYRDNLKRLDEWLENNATFESAGMSYGVYWNSPLVPGPFKRSEIHIPIRQTTSKPDSNLQEIITTPIK